MSEEQEQKRGFKVEDRRRFSESGEAREGVADGADSAPPNVEAPRSRASRPSPEEAALAEITFTTFVLSLSTQALAHLGEIPNPMDGQVSKDLTAAKQLIDILGMLAAKTKGNLDETEAGLLDSALYDLRLKYVEQTRRS